MKILKISLAIFAGFLLFLATSLILLLERVDRREYQGLAIYKETLEAVRTGKKGEGTSGFKAGWASENITPSYPVEIAGYGLRNKFTGVADSVYVQVFLIDNGRNRAALISADLLIFPPAVVKEIIAALPSGFTSDQLFFSASHTHNGPGGWMKGLAAEYVAGETDEKFIGMISAATVKALKRAESRLQPCILGHSSLNVPGFVKNRLVPQGSEYDLAHFLRAVTEQDTALVFTYAAHSNTFPRTVDSISRDYPGNISDILEKEKQAGFVMFCAGPMGSMGIDCMGMGDKDCREAIADRFFLRTHRLSYQKVEGTELKCGKVALQLKPLAYRISENIRIRPWLFALLMGSQESFISYLKIGNFLFIGTPCDFSGELAKELHKEAGALDLNLVLTSFNGGYIGYVTPDAYCDLPHYETIDMNWAGTGTGSYFSDIIRKIIIQLGSSDGK